jgi:uncharacterized Tic20 family protein
MNSDFKTLPKGTKSATTNSADDFKYHLIPLYTFMWMLNLLLPFKYIGGVMYIAHYMRKDDFDKIDWTKLGLMFILSPSIWDLILITFAFILVGFVVVTCPFWCGPVLCIAVLVCVFVAFCCFQGQDGWLNQTFGGFSQI